MLHLFSLWLLIFPFSSDTARSSPIESAEYVEEVSVDAKIDDYGAIAGSPLKGSLQITHDKRLKIDENSVHLENKRLPVELLKEVYVSHNSPLIISIYQFEIPSQKPGLYMLGEVSVKVGGKEYHSLPTSYQVQGTRTFDE